MEFLVTLLVEEVGVRLLLPAILLDLVYQLQEEEEGQVQP
jgi:hypothetical protein